MNYSCENHRSRGIQSIHGMKVNLAEEQKDHCNPEIASRKLNLYRMPKGWVRTPIELRCDSRRKIELTPVTSARARLFLIHFLCVPVHQDAETCQKLRDNILGKLLVTSSSYAFGL
ncbi:hypothetical protein AVEN_55562-1 [Araneus ventricosus]|uniref:Uncharacterized protein n=1 Tax=Araneus ventricosus TaxID=182803 RepID=A0A4Y2G1Q4_ARAVE|nr:hypothetical protein AVEN_55562-1 [Araneus ventricosus]